MPKAAHTSIWQTSDAFITLFLITGGSLQYFLPLSLSGVMSNWLAWIMGSVMMVIGLLIFLAAKRQLTKMGQPSAPGIPTTLLVTDGIYSYSRHPLYLALVIFLAGLALVTGLVWWLILLAPFIGLTQLVLINPEEKYLNEVFEKEYKVYLRKTRMWV